ncbi:MAG: zinc-binding dehydrogenase, partial [Pseudorhodobacter sp.]
KDGIRRIAGTSSESRDSMQQLVKRFEEGSYRPSIGMVLPFDKIRTAHAMASARHKPGNLILRMV